MYVLLQSAEEFSWSHEPVHPLRLGRRVPKVFLFAADYEEVPRGLKIALIYYLLSQLEATSTTT